MLFLAGILCAQPDPFLGTWKMDPAQSSFGNEPRLKWLTVKWEREGGGFRVQSEGEREDGMPFRDSYVAYYDGKEYRNKGPWNFDTVVNRQIDPLTREDSFTKDGKRFGVIRREVSADHKRMKVTATFWGPRGEDRQVTVLLRQ
jgi:hypothetical protein